MDLNKKILMADIGILFIAMTWGFNFSFIKWAVSYVSPMYYLSFRFLIAGVILALIFRNSIRNIGKSELKCGLLAGTFLALSFIAQTVGLQYTSPGKAGFLASSCVIIVPILMAILYKTRITISIAVGSITCFIGLALLSLTENFTLQWGDFLEILCALFFSVQTIVIYRYAKEVHPIRMTIVQTLVAGAICLIISLSTEPIPGMEIICMPVVVSIGYGVIFCTIVSFVIQGYAQKITPPSHVSIILSFEAVFALALSVVIGFEEFTERSMLGCAVLFIGFMITQFKLPWEKERLHQRKSYLQDS